MKKILLLILASCAVAFGQLQYGCSGAPVSFAAINNATSQGAVQALLTNTQAWGALVQLDQTSAITSGAISFQVSRDATNFVNLPATSILNPVTFAPAGTGNPYAFVPSVNQAFLIPLNGSAGLQTVLTNPLLGSGAVTVYVTAICSAPIFPTLGNLDVGGNLKVAISNTSGLGAGAFTPTRGINISAIVTPWLPPGTVPYYTDVCNGPNLTSTPVSTSSNAVIINGLNGKILRICGGVLIATTAGTYSIVEGTGSTCGTNTLAVIGGTTASAGPAIAANGGFLMQSKIAVQGDSICILLTGTGQVAGNMLWAY